MTCLSHRRERGPLSGATIIRSSLWRPTWRERLRLLFGARVEVSTASHMGMSVEVVRKQRATSGELTIKARLMRH